MLTAGDDVLMYCELCGVLTAGDDVLIHCIVSCVGCSPLVMMC